jgi:hypothetical protein
MTRNNTSTRDTTNTNTTNMTAMTAMLLMVLCGSGPQSSEAFSTPTFGGISRRTGTVGATQHTSVGSQRRTAASLLVPAQHYYGKVKSGNNRRIVSSNISSSRSHKSNGVKLFQTPDEQQETEAAAVPSTPETILDEMLSSNNLKNAIQVIKDNPSLQLTKSRLKGIFDTIEIATAQKEENMLPTETAPNSAVMAYPPTSKARTQMTDMYQTLKDVGCLSIFGACNEESGFPAAGSKMVPSTMLETVSRMSMVALTPQGSGNGFLVAGLGLAVVEGLLSAYTGIDLGYFALATLGFIVVDKLAVNGASVEFLTKLFYPEC